MAEKNEIEELMGQTGPKIEKVKVAFRALDNYLIKVESMFFFFPPFILSFLFIIISFFTCSFVLSFVISSSSLCLLFLLFYLLVLNLLSLQEANFKVVFSLKKRRNRINTNKQYFI